MNIFCCFKDKSIPALILIRSKVNHLIADSNVIFPREFCIFQPFTHKLALVPKQTQAQHLCLGRHMSSTCARPTQALHLCQTDTSPALVPRSTNAQHLCPDRHKSSTCARTDTSRAPVSVRANVEGKSLLK